MVCPCVSVCSVRLRAQAVRVLGSLDVRILHPCEYCRVAVAVAVAWNARCRIVGRLHILESIKFL